MFDFSVDCNAINISDILNIHKYLIKKYKIMFSLIKQVFIVLLRFRISLARVAKVSNRKKCLFLNDEPSMVWPTLIDLNSVELKYYPFMISLDKCTGSCNVLSPKICVPKDTNLETFNVIPSKNDAGRMKKHFSFDC